MAYLMTDVAAGSNAALQLQQNMAAAPDVQQQQAMAVQQQQANLERTKLANLVADTGIKADQESKQKLSALTQSPEFKAADDVKKLQLISAKQFELGKVEEGAKTLTASELYQSKDLANRQKQLDLNSQQVGNAYAVASALKSPEQINGFFKDLETQKPEQYKTLVDQVGAERFAKLTPEEKIEVTKNLMLNARGQMAKQIKEIEVEKTILMNESKERIARIREDGALNRKMVGGTNDEMKSWNTYNIRQQAIERSGQKTLENLDKAVDEAQSKLDKTSWFNPAGKEKEVLQRAIGKRDEFQRNQIQKEIDLATSAPDFPGKDTIVNNLNRQLELFSAPATTDKPTDTPAPAAAKSDVPSGAKTHDGYPARKNADGSYSTEVSITVTNPKLNGGKPTNIPSLWGGKEVDENTAVENALATGKKYESFSTIPEAVKAAKERSKAGGAGATGTGTATSPLSMPQSKDQLVDGSYYQTAKGTLVWDKASSTFIEPKVTKEDTTKYTRSKGVRGNWEYTRSTRGMTKAEYAELDKKKKE